MHDDAFFAIPVLRIGPTAVVIPTTPELGTYYTHGRLAISSHESIELETNGVATPDTPFGSIRKCTEDEALLEVHGTKSVAIKDDDDDKALTSDTTSFESLVKIAREHNLEARVTDTL